MRRGSIFPALVLILLGVWFLAGNLGVRLPGMDAMWPIFPLGGGLLFLGGYFFDRRDPGLIFVGLAATLIGAVVGPFAFCERDFEIEPDCKYAEAFLARRTARP